MFFGFNAPKGVLQADPLEKAVRSSSVAKPHDVGSRPGVFAEAGPVSRNKVVFATTPAAGNIDRIIKLRRSNARLNPGAKVSQMAAMSAFSGLVSGLTRVHLRSVWRNSRTPNQLSG